MLHYLSPEGPWFSFVGQLVLELDHSRWLSQRSSRHQYHMRSSIYGQRERASELEGGTWESKRETERDREGRREGESETVS